MWLQPCHPGCDSSAHRPSQPPAGGGRGSGVGHCTHAQRGPCRQSQTCSLSMPCSSTISPHSSPHHSSVYVAVGAGAPVEQLHHSQRLHSLQVLACEAAGAGRGGAATAGDPTASWPCISGEALIKAPTGQLPTASALRCPPPPVPAHPLHRTRQQSPHRQLVLQFAGRGGQVAFQDALLRVRLVLGVHVWQGRRGGCLGWAGRESECTGSW